MLNSWLLRLLISGLSLLVVDWLVEGVYVNGVGAALLASLILGIINATVRPILIFLTLPISFLTLGLFLLVINGLTYWLTAQIVPGFEVDGFIAAFFGALITSLVTWILMGFATGKYREK